MTIQDRVPGTIDDIVSDLRHREEHPGDESGHACLTCENRRLHDKVEALTRRAEAAERDMEEAQGLAERLVKALFDIRNARTRPGMAHDALKAEGLV